MTLHAPASSAASPLNPSSKKPAVTPLTQALKIAGVSLPPLNKRVWLWLHDHPDKTSTEIANALKAKMSAVSSVAGIMVKRRMAQSRKDVSGRHGSAGVLRYKTLGKAYELLPKPHPIPASVPSAPPVTILRAPAPAPAPAQAVNDAPEASIKLTAARVLETLNVRESLALYHELHKLFSCVPERTADLKKSPSLARL